MNTTEYLASHIAANTAASREVRSLINKARFDADAAVKLHDWVLTHMREILTRSQIGNPYNAPWPTWMKDILTEQLKQVDWNELVNRLRK